jgi:hypothetical protein
VAILEGLFLTNALSNVRVHEGRPSIEKDFLVGMAQTCSVTGALWLAFDEYREVSHLAREGREKFFAQVKAYEVLPSPPTTGRWVTAGVGVALLVFAIALMSKGGKKSGH